VGATVLVGARQTWFAWAQAAAARGVTGGEYVPAIDLVAPVALDRQRETRLGAACGNDPVDPWYDSPRATAGVGIHSESLLPILAPDKRLGYQEDRVGRSVVYLDSCSFSWSKGASGQASKLGRYG
jgi:hypothetical protein